jgi:uncharacterized protein (TIGR03382 family)
VSLVKKLLFVGVAAAVAVLWSRTADAHYERCTIYNGQDTCLAGDTCTVQDAGGTGICIPPPCKDNTDCKKLPLRQCDLRQTYPVCVECFSDGECTAPLLCELDPRSFVSNRCSECTVGRIGACGSNPKGHACIYDRGSCGCNDHADCEATHFCRRNDCIPRPGGAGSKPPADDDAGVAAAVDGGAGGPDVDVVASGPSAGGSGCSSASPQTVGAPFAAIFAGLLTATRLRRRAKGSRAASSSRSAT